MTFKPTTILNTIKNVIPVITVTRRQSEGASTGSQIMEDRGNAPYTVNVEDASKSNKSFRKALWTGGHMQLVLMNIPADLYESSRIDGANTFQQFTNVTLPYMIFVMTPTLISSFTGNINNFNIIYLLSGGGPTYIGDSAGQTDLLVTWLYKLTMDNQDYNLAAVIGILTFVVLATVALITYRSSGSYKNEEGFK